MLSIKRDFFETGRSLTRRLIIPALKQGLPKSSFCSGVSPKNAWIEEENQ